MASAAAGQLPLDARQLALRGLQGFLVLEDFGKLLGVARQVCLLSPQAVLRGFELRSEGVEDVVQALKEANAIGLYLVQVERAGGGVLECVGTLGAAQTKADGAGRRWPHGDLEAAVRRNRRRRAGAGAVACNE